MSLPHENAPSSTTGAPTPQASADTPLDPFASSLASDLLNPVPGSARSTSEPRAELVSAARLLVDQLGARPTGLQSTGVTTADRDRLAEHLGRETLQAAKGRDFRTAWRTTKAGTTVPRLLSIGSKALARCQYACLTHPQHASVAVIDVDLPGGPGGRVDDLSAEVLRAVSIMAGAGRGPAWIGVNPVNGKSQLIWLIDPVYAGKNGDSANMRLLHATQRALGDVIGGDPAFSHRLSRSPFYTGDDPTAYRWHVQHHRIDRLSVLIEEARTMNGDTATSSANTAGGEGPRPQRFTSGRDLLNAVKNRREEAETFKALTGTLEADVPTAEAMDTDRIDGVKVLWVTTTRAARDETAFRHALAEAHHLRGAGKRMTDAAIIDAYERGYAVAHAVGADNRVEELPAMRDRLTMARRVRGYVIAGKSSTTSAGGPAGAGRANSAERKALSTMGRRGGQKAAQRWKTDPDGDYAQGRRDAMKKTHLRKKLKGSNTRARVLGVVTESLLQTGVMPSGAAVGRELGMTRKTACEHIRALKASGQIPDT